MAQDDNVSAAVSVMEAHITALNAHDVHALANTLHFPHFRMSGTRVKVWETPEQYFSDFQDRAGANWKRSEFNDIRVVGGSVDKVHLDVEVARFDNNDEELVRFRSLWVITNEDGRWAAKFRSSFASR